ncbi:putative bifunctional diguanylate cyclase/phosphodiesterase [Halopseudomonas salegens]|uniref:cyclic-guanylate-specific phosphodiesterase n=1 Tax=Halopseudomonas salegens TaxID=1434072 RepID=A0A1H2EP24_9GAMM|nr:bifunctional diguanylate cyclase/phosphodiesterase [Halopseudomonas salegens]SDT96877.1 PAS domain S-box-containing protein/diguanylate cyclase (GGDEF) domain-containing protein [Halopseudomonas salegens]
MSTPEAKSDDGFIALFQRLPIACLLVRVSDSRILAVNPSFENLFGWSTAQLVNHHSRELPLWRDAEQRQFFLDELAQSGSVQQHETEFRCRDNSLKPCLVYIEHLEINGELCRLSMAHDMSERIASEQALVSSESKFAALFKDAPEPYVLFEKRSGTIAEINSTFTEVFGYQSDNVIGKTALEIGLWKYPEKRPATIEKLIRDGRLRNEPAELLTADGRVLHCEISSNFVRFGNERRTLTSFKDVTEQKRIEARVKHQAYHDALTDLPNRLLLNDRIDQHLAFSERYGLSCALLFFDLDHFKHINDSLGHSHGDAVLQEVSQRLLNTVRKADTVARLGGDEFVVLLTGLTGTGDNIAEQARTSAEKLLMAVAAPMQIEGHSLQLGCSIGIALAPTHCNSAEDLLKYADTALYGVKASGRNAIALFEPHMQVVASQRLQLETELRLALQQQQFILHYQAQIDARDQRIIGAEALLRWRHPEKGIITPGQFMPVLEDSGMILDVGHWVMREACRLVATLLDHKAIDPDHFSVSINISPRQFRQHDFVQQVAAAVTDQGIPAQCLKLEITESMMLQNITDTVAKMQQLRDMGIHFAIDDFGTGYSSLSYLKRLPVDLLKIDQSFIRDCTHDSNDAEIVRAIIAMARSLKLELIAEGVETREQLAFLQQQDCHAYQGYLFSPAVPEQAFLQQLGQTVKPAAKA